MLERITNFMAHPETLLPMADIEDPTARFVSVVKFYLSGWHIKPPGVKKPLNPILGETFTCYWQFPDNTKGYYISEQTSHHPPKSSYFYMAPEHHIRIDGCLKPRSKFLGNSAASLMEGIAVLRLLNRGHSKKGESYIVTQPNMYARGILFGKMKYELGDHSYVRCPELGLSADIQFKTKGYFGGMYNEIGGTIKNDHTGETLYELSGTWTGEMFIKNTATGKKELLFNATKARPTPPLVRPLEEQDERESQKLWLKTAQAVKDRNHEVATDEKTKIEDMQRDEAAKRAEDGVEWHPRLFRRVHGGPGGSEEGEEDLDWILNANIDGKTAKEQVEQILAVTPILPGQKSNQENAIPPQHSSATPQTSKAPSAAAGPSATERDTVDNGQKDTQQSQPSQQSQSSQLPRLPSDLRTAQVQNNGKQQKDLESTLRSTSTSEHSQGPLLDLHNDLRRDLPSAGSSVEAQRKTGDESVNLKRHDTGSSNADEFVDAES